LFISQQQVQEITKKLQSIETQENTSEMITHLQSQYETLHSQKMKKQQNLMTISHKIQVAKQTPLPLKIQGPSYTQLLQEVTILVKTSENIQEQITKEQDPSVIKNFCLSLLQRITQLKSLILPAQEPIATPKVPQELLDQEKQTKEDIESISQEIQQTQQLMHDEHEKTNQQRKDLIDLQHHFQSAQAIVNQHAQQLNSIQIQKARIETKMEDLKRNIEQEMKEIPVFEKQKINFITSSLELYDQMQKIKRQLDIIGGIDPEVIKEYKETKERHDFLQEQIIDLQNTITSLEQVIKELDQQIKELFSSSFEMINKEFDRYFKILFSGGKASLKILYPSDITSEESDDSEEQEELPLLKRLQSSIKEHEIEGVEIEARPAGKNITNIQMLSGGERALTSIALICAIVSSNPSPFVVLDEVDAALDESNSTKFAHIVNELSSKTQFIVITHNRSSMEKANVLYGVTMGDDGISRLVSLSFEDAKKSIIANRA
ncbi:MAG: AAA family ATPase, partial [Nanoarchaeota archaeon]|nr:AAA family ATPase [Nanoarchaeota archaeon]